MILCPRCRAAWSEKTLYCYQCGASMREQAPGTPQPTIAATPAFPAPQLSIGDVPSLEAGWAEFSGVQAPAGQPYPPLPVAPGAYGSIGNYPPYAPGMPPPMTPVPQKRGMSLGVMLLLGLLTALLIFGGVFAGVSIGQAHSGTAQRQTTVSPTATLAPDQLYKQATSQIPTFAETLQNPATSSWSVLDNPTYSCKIQADGLHVAIQDLQHFAYCTSGLGTFINVAFQVDMKVLTGDGGGLILRGDTTAGNLYYFHIFPSGLYRIYKGQNHRLFDPLSNGSASSFVAGQKNTVTAIAQGNQMYFYINQKFLTMVQDSAYTSGDIGVSSASSTTAAEVVYTNAEIWRL